MLDLSDCFHDIPEGLSGVSREQALGLIDAWFRYWAERESFTLMPWRWPMPPRDGYVYGQRLSELNRVQLYQLRKRVQMAYAGTKVEPKVEGKSMMAKPSEHLVPKQITSVSLDEKNTLGLVTLFDDNSIWVRTFDSSWHCLRPAVSAARTADKTCEPVHEERGWRWTLMDEHGVDNGRVYVSRKEAESAIDVADVRSLAPVLMPCGDPTLESELARLHRIVAKARATANQQRERARVAESRLRQIAAIGAGAGTAVKV